MKTAESAVLPFSWVRALQNHAPSAASDFLTDVGRYLLRDSPERVPQGREVETLRNLLAAYLTSTQAEAVLHEVAISSLRPAQSAESSALPATGLLAIGSMVATAVVLARQRR